MGGGRHHRLRSATPEYDLEGFEFFTIILDNSSRRQMLDGHQPKNVKLRQAGSGLHRLWGVEVLFRYDGNTTLTVKVFNTTMCRMRYHDDDDASNGSSNSDSGYSKSSSDSGCNKSSIEDEEEWSGEEEE